MCTTPALGVVNFKCVWQWHYVLHRVKGGDVQPNFFPHQCFIGIISDDKNAHHHIQSQGVSINTLFPKLNFANDISVSSLTTECRASGHRSLCFPRSPNSAIHSSSFCGNSLSYSCIGEYILIETDSFYSNEWDPTVTSTYQTSLIDKMPCSGGLVDCFLKVTLVYQPCCLVPRCQGWLGELSENS